MPLVQHKGLMNDLAQFLFAALHGTGGASRVLRETRLTRRQLRVMELHLGFVDGEEWSFARIGTHYGVSGEAARKSFNTALSKVRAWACAHTHA